jgi:hypothetical protein
MWTISKASLTFLTMSEASLTYLTMTVMKQQSLGCLVLGENEVLGAG